MKTLKDGTMSEAALQSAIVKAARLYGWLVYHTYDSRRSNHGFPDLIMLYKGAGVALELKSGRGKLTEDQQTWIDAFQAAGFYGFVGYPNNLDDVLHMLKFIKSKEDGNA